MVHSPLHRGEFQSREAWFALIEAFLDWHHCKYCAILPIVRLSVSFPQTRVSLTCLNCWDLKTIVMLVIFQSPETLAVRLLVSMSITADFIPIWTCRWIPLGPGDLLPLRVLSWSIVSSLEILVSVKDMLWARGIAICPLSSAVKRDLRNTINFPAILL